MAPESRESEFRRERPLQANGFANHIRSDFTICISHFFFNMRQIYCSLQREVICLSTDIHFFSKPIWSSTLEPKKRDLKKSTYLMCQGKGKDIPVTGHGGP
jgi:hypothetical protein